MRRATSRSRSFLIGAALVLGADLVAAGDVDPYAASTKTCQAVVNDHVEEEFPKAKRVGWEMETVEAETSDGVVRFYGEGSYRGDSGRRRTYEFDCRYDEEAERVISAWWVSSFDRRRHVVVEAPAEPEITRDDIRRACRAAVDSHVREDFEHSIRKVELIADGLELESTEIGRDLVGQGRFLGGGGNWHRFDFTCSFDEEAREVTEVTWKHLGDERDLDE